MLSYLSISGLIALVSAQSVSVTVPSTAPSATASDSASGAEPCAAVASSQAEAIQSNSTHHRPPTIPAGLAYQCLQSVSVDKDGDTKLLNDIKVYLQRATDTVYFKDLPDRVCHNSYATVFELTSCSMTIHPSTSSESSMTPRRRFRTGASIASGTCSLQSLR